jgi:hypothetical protein
MKSKEQIDHARDAVCKAMVKPGMSDMQKSLLAGMSVTLCWVADAGGATLQRIIDGEPFVRHTVQEEKGAMDKFSMKIAEERPHA